MCDILCKTKFYNKCKSSIKFINIRIEMVRKKKNATCKFLTEDIVILLKSGLDYHANLKIDKLLDEKKKLSCYEFIEQCNECISKNLHLLQKQRECPEECKEAVSSLIYAAARVPEVPELRRLRDTFKQRYGSSLEIFVNKQFVQMFRREVHSKETKFQLLHEIAEEFSLEWDSKALQQKLFKPPSVSQNYESSKEDIYKSKANSPDVTYKMDRNSEYEPLTSSDRDFRESSSTSLGSMTDDEPEPEITKPHSYRFIPPPYTKPRLGKHDEIKPKADLETQEVNKPKQRSIRRLFVKPPPGFSDNNKDKAKKENKEDSSVTRRHPTHYGKKILKSMTFNLRSLSSTKRETGAAKEDVVLPEPMKRHARATTLQPQRMNNHVHPNLPDYDELTAHIAHLQKR